MINIFAHFYVSMSIVMIVSLYLLAFHNTSRTTLLIVSGVSSLSLGLLKELYDVLYRVNTVNAFKLDVFTNLAGIFVGLFVMRILIKEDLKWNLKSIKKLED